MSPGLPAFADRFGITINVDLTQPAHAVFEGIGRFFVFFAGRFEQRPQKRERKKTPIQASERRLGLNFLFLWVGRVTNGQSYGESDSERAKNSWHRILAQENFRAFARRARSLFRLFPSVASRLGNFLSRLLQTPLCSSHIFSGALHRRRQRIVFDKLIPIRIDHINDSHIRALLRLFSYRSSTSMRRPNHEIVNEERKDSK